MPDPQRVALEPWAAVERGVDVRALAHAPRRSRQGARRARVMLGALPSHVQACLFDMDGVLTQTAVVHERAWKVAFAPVLRDAAPFTSDDYRRFVDGRRRLDGARAFLTSRGIQLPEGGAADPGGAATVHGVANAKDAALRAALERDSVEAFPGSVAFLRAVRAHHLRCGVVSSSANCAAILRAAGLATCFDARVDDAVARRDGLAGKPAPDMFLAGAVALDTDPTRVAVFEDAVAGVAAARAGRFGLVVGVDRAGRGAELRAAGADMVVGDLAELISADS